MVGKPYLKIVEILRLVASYFVNSFKKYSELTEFFNSYLDSIFIFPREHFDQNNSIITIYSRCRLKCDVNLGFLSSYYI